MTRSLPGYAALTPEPSCAAITTARDLATASEKDVGARNYLIEGVSGTGKTAVAEELQRRGYHVLHGDRELSYVGDPTTGEPLDGPVPGTMTDSVAWGHEHHVWDVDKLRSVVADHRNAVSFFCGGSRNFPQFIDMFDGVFVLDVDPDTLSRRLAERSGDEFGGRSAERELIERLHATKADVPRCGVVIDATAPLAVVVDDILSRCSEADQGAC